MSFPRTSSSDSTVRHFRSLLSPLEAADQPQWLLAATPIQQRLLAELQQQGRQAREAAMEHFARLSTVYDYAKQFDDFGIKDSKDVTPADLARHSNADLVTYTAYLKPHFRLASLREDKMDAFEATLREEALIAQIKGHVQASGSSCLKQVLANLAQDKRGGTPSQALLSTRHPLLHLTVLGNIPVPQILLICHDSRDDSHCVAFVPGHPQHPLKEYPNRRHFLASLQRELESVEFQAFFERFIPVRHHSAFWAGLHDTSDAAVGPALGTAALASGLRVWAFDKMVERITDDAWTLVRATLADGLGSSDEVRNFSTLIQSHLMLGAGVGVSAGEDVEGRSPSDSITPLRWVRLPDGSLERWSVDLSRYRLRSDVEVGEPDEQGLYQINGDNAICINGHFYLVEWDNALKNGVSPAGPKKTSTRRSSSTTSTVPGTIAWSSRSIGTGCRCCGAWGQWCRASATINCWISPASVASATPNCAGSTASMKRRRQCCAKPCCARASTPRWPKPCN
ncbi:dermonecrotic toxin domain-containing protein [Pseudomonas donghuensis]|uniref:dermonecrotic toxin domain-containing protein n=1 Tax=Pseudomonas donghuensis TaxID=1163398 RepID=UPI002E1245FB|nr:DUF6543 domain-containing protein [Pseudomonas donghuensis]